MKQFILKSIRFYQRYFNFTNPVMKTLFVTDAACRYSPTCSEYMYQAVGKFGIINGLYKGIRRILRCHPFSKGGHDPVANK